MTAKWTWFTTLSIGLLWAYLLLVLFAGETQLGVSIRIRHWGMIVLLSFGAIYVITWWLDRRQLVSTSHLKRAGLLSLVVLVSILVVDIAYGAYSNRDPANLEDMFARDYRETDSIVWLDELSLPRYYPTSKNVLLYKPNVTLSTYEYGRWYSSKLADSPKAASASELKRMEISIDEHGFRDTTPLEEARIFALGDSYTFGSATTQDKTWVEVLERRIAQPVYNLGMGGVSLKRNLNVLEYLLETKGDSINIRHLLWMVWEGKEFYGSYATYRPPPQRTQEMYGPVVASLLSLPRRFRDGSVIYRLLTGRLGLDLPNRKNEAADAYMVDGIASDVPLYYSERFGYRFFAPEILQRMNQSKSYVLDHPKRPLLDQTFREMTALSAKYGFKVTVLIVPTAPRLYAGQYEGLPPMSKEPHFINYVTELSNAQGFETFDFYPLMVPYAEEELLFWRDDSHPNERGHEVMAELVARLVFGQ